MFGGGSNKELEQWKCKCIAATEERNDLRKLTHELQMTLSRMLKETAEREETSAVERKERKALEEKVSQGVRNEQMLREKIQAVERERANADEKRVAAASEAKREAEVLERRKATFETTIQNLREATTALEKKLEESDGIAKNRAKTIEELTAKGHQLKSAAKKYKHRMEAQHKEKLEEIERKHAVAAAALRTAQENALKEANERYERDLDASTRHLEDETNALREKFRTDLKESKDQHRASLEAVERAASERASEATNAFRENMKRLDVEHETALESARETHANEMSETKRSHDDVVASLKVESKMLRDRQDVLEKDVVDRDGRVSALESRLSDASTEASRLANEIAAERRAAEETLRAAKDAHDTVSASSANLVAEMKTLRARHAALTTERDALAETEISHRTLAEDRANSLRDLEETHRTSVVQLEERENAIVRRKLSEMEAKHAELTKRNDEAHRSSLAKMTATLESARRESERTLRNARIELEADSKASLKDALANAASKHAKDVELAVEAAREQATKETSDRISRDVDRVTSELESARRKLDAMETETLSYKEHVETERSRVVEAHRVERERMEASYRAQATELREVVAKGAGDGNLHAEALEMLRDVLMKEHASALESAKRNHAESSRKELSEVTGALEKRLKETEDVASDRARRMEEIASENDRLESDAKAYKVRVEAEHEKAMDATRRGYADASATLEATHAKALKKAREEHESALDASKRMLAEEANVLREESTVALRAAEEKHTRALQAAAQAASEERATVMKTHQETTRRLVDEHEVALQQALQSLKTMEAETTSYKERVEAERELAANEASRRGALESSEAQDAHAKELVRLGARLESAEAETKRAVEDANLARLQEEEESKKVNALTEALSVCRQIEKEQRRRAEELEVSMANMSSQELDDAFGALDVDGSGPSTKRENSGEEEIRELRSALEQEKAKNKTLNDDLVRACASAAAFQTKLSQLQSKATATTTSSRTTPTKQGDSKPPTMTKASSSASSAWGGLSSLWGSVSAAGGSGSSSTSSAAAPVPRAAPARAPATTQSARTPSVAIDVLFGKGALGIELKTLDGGRGTYIHRLTKPSLLGDTSWATKYNQYVRKKIGKPERMLIPGMRPVSVNGRPLPKTTEEVAAVLRQTKRPMKIHFLPPLPPT